jgi:hypothetical protein
MRWKFQSRTRRRRWIKRRATLHMVFIWTIITTLSSFLSSCGHVITMPLGLMSCLSEGFYSSANLSY